MHRPLIVAGFVVAIGALFWAKKSSAATKGAFPKDEKFTNANRTGAHPERTFPTGTLRKIRDTQFTCGHRVVLVRDENGSISHATLYNDDGCPDARPRFRDFAGPQDKVLFPTRTVPGIPLAQGDAYRSSFDPGVETHRAKLFRAEL